MFGKEPNPIIIGGSGAAPIPDIYKDYTEQVKPKTNIYHIFIKGKGLINTFDIERPMIHQVFLIKYKDKTYLVKPDRVFPKDVSFLTTIKRKLQRKNINYEYNVFFKEGKDEAILHHTKEKISGTLLHSVLYSKGTEAMLRSLRDKGRFDLGGLLNIRMMIIMGAGVVIAIVLLQNFGFIPKFLPF